MTEQNLTERKHVLNLITELLGTSPYGSDYLDETEVTDRLNLSKEITEERLSKMLKRDLIRQVMIMRRFNLQGEIKLEELKVEIEKLKLKNETLRTRNPSYCPKKFIFMAFIAGAVILNLLG